MAASDVRKEFGTVVRNYRQQLGISQEALAERADLHRTYVTDVERGARNLSLESISKLAQALRIPMGALFAPTLGHAASFEHADAVPVDILLVEDDPKDRELTLAAFKQAKLANQIHVVCDGAEALDFLFSPAPHARRNDRNLPGVVLLDLNLPKVTGLGVLRRIKVDERTRKIQVVVLTCRAAAMTCARPCSSERMPSS
jgi:CheY-like chemotaxis protein/DNA-binding XRE family transcriptional regulator